MEHHWFKNVVVYTIDVKSYCDSNADGMGDFPGLISKLDYISHLGITCIWLLPFFPSPLKDNGYDITDYYSVDPRLGTLSDFQEFVRKAAERGISVIIDLVMNHTSDEHPWFQAAKRDAHSLFHDYYVWSKIPPPNDPHDCPAFPDSEHGLWHFDEAAQAYYYHKFYHFQPDLKMNNPRVQEEIFKVMDFWLALGVAGFRLDAAPIMIHKKGLENTKLPNSHDFLCELRKFLTERRKEGILMGEVDVDGTELVDYFADGSGLHLIFNFLLNASLMGSVAQEKAETLIRAWRELPIIPDSGTWLNFLRNLDELNIGQLPEREKNMVYKHLAPEKNMRVYHRGIRRRLASMLQGNSARLQMAYSLLFSLPGTPMIVYGDEIGMGDKLELWEREAVRTPMQWDAGPQAGFSKAEQLYRPLVTETPFDAKNVNVARQMDEEDSLLQKIRRFIYLRKIHPEIGHGKLRWIATNHPSVVAHVCHWKNDIVLAVHNFSGEKLAVSFNLKDLYVKRFENVLGDPDVENLKNGDYRMTIESYGYYWFKLHYEKEK